MQPGNVTLVGMLHTLAIWNFLTAAAVVAMFGDVLHHKKVKCIADEKNIKRKSVIKCRELDSVIIYIHIPLLNSVVLHGDN